MEDTPFFISPNPNSLYLTPSLKATVHKTKFTIDKRQGLTTILGDVGLGKSSVLRFLHVEYEARDKVTTTLVPTPIFSSEFAFLKSICQDFDLPPRRSLTAQMEDLQGYLLAQYKEGFNVVLFIDEAQKLTFKMLELIRAILNYETHRHKLMQIVLAGQLELRERLRNEQHKALLSRIFTNSLLSGLTLGETRQMVEFRCELAEIKNPFSDAIIESIYQQTGGVPRDVLRLCALSYDLAQLSGVKMVSEDILEMAVNDGVKV